MLTMFLLLSAAVASNRAEIPSEFVADTVYVNLPVGRDAIRLYTDTGGGSLIVSRAAASRLHLRITPISDPDAKAELGPNAAAIEPPKLADPIPPLPARAFLVERAAQIKSWPEQGDGFVGAKWFEGGVWTWDYVHHRLLREGSTWAPQANAHSAALGFKTGADGTRQTSFARIEVNVDGQAIPMLLDTGAETMLTKAALDSLGDGGPSLRATSMLRASDFDRLHEEHPDWPFIANAQLTTNAPMLRVPFVEIAGLRSGPVWFTRRSDEVYAKFMSPMMDAPVEGSLGGNAFHSMIMTIDYPKATAYFLQPNE